jgi:hypothetical protein
LERTTGFEPATLTSTVMLSYSKKPFARHRPIRQSPRQR